jgi:hypothetical protein
MFILQRSELSGLPVLLVVQPFLSLSLGVEKYISVLDVFIVTHKFIKGGVYLWKRR